MRLLAQIQQPQEPREPRAASICTRRRTRMQTLSVTPKSIALSIATSTSASIRTIQNYKVKYYVVAITTNMNISGNSFLLDAYARPHVRRRAAARLNKSFVVWLTSFDTSTRPRARTRTRTRAASRKSKKRQELLSLSLSLSLSLYFQRA